MRLLMHRCVLFCPFFLFSHHMFSLCPLSLPLRSRPAVCRFEVFCPKAGRRRTNDQLRATDPQVTRPQTVTHTYIHTHTKSCVYFSRAMKMSPVCPDHGSVCGLMKLTTEPRRRQMAWRDSTVERKQALHNMLTICHIALNFSMHHITSSRQFSANQASCSVSEPSLTLHHSLLSNVGNSSSVACC